jgi:predicted permease
MHAPALYRWLLFCYPSAFRHEYGREMVLDFSAELSLARQRRQPLRALSLWARAFTDALTIAPREHTHVMMQDIRYTLRGFAANPAFALVAILSLALGIGANTAIFGLWNGVLHSALSVPDPGQLVILTDPASAGIAVGSQTGDRSLLTYAEYELLRDNAGVFSGVLAAQSILDNWQLRVGAGPSEDVSGRMVSLDYFRVLGVTPVIGRAFAPSDSSTGAPYAVISYDYWQRRFGGRSDALGQPVSIRKAALTIIGVAPRGFIGETTGQRPDIWAPLAEQPYILPGRDWLHDTPPDKVMWLHVLARLNPGVSVRQAQERANLAFKPFLESQYGATLSAEARREFLNQSLKVRPAAGGASPARGDLSDPLSILLAAVALILLIACGNLANLLLARSAARRREIAVRLALGASRQRLLRQLVTESLVLAFSGGLAGLLLAYAFHRGLVSLITRIDRDFDLAFRLDLAVLLFALAATLISAFVFGAAPAWLATRAGAAETLKSGAHGSASSRGHARWGRVLVAAQLALSLPLLFGAGLLLRTLSNLRNVDLGYSKDRLLVLRMDAQTAGYPQDRREPLIRRIAGNLRRIPGVSAVSYSENGLFSGRDSGDEVLVEGYTRKGDSDRGARWDQAGPGYFSTLGAPILMGRDINEADQPSSPFVCVINEAFAKQFFASRNPIGMRVTSIYGDKRTHRYVVGVARDVRTHSLRGKVDPRYFVPLTQPEGEYDGVVFLVRSSGDPGVALAAVLKAIQNIDPSIPIRQAGPVDQRIDQRLASDLILSRLTLAFGAVAAALVAIGLYGLLAYAVVRRRGEIGIRIAIGAEPARVVRAVLRELLWTIVIGIGLGAALAYVGARLLASQLFGLAPHDPLTLAGALALLLVVAAAAAWIPARRAARLEPMVALRTE